MSSAPGTYPSELEAEVATRDGSLACVRPVRPDDAERLLTFLRALPDEDRRLRFFTLANDLARTARDETTVDYVSSLGLVATVGPDERVVGHALYAPYGEGRAEVAFATARDYQGRGLATLLLGQLAEAAASHGIETFEAIVLPENQRMLTMLRESGFPLKVHYAGGTVDVIFPTSLTPDALASFALREETAAANAVHRVLYPRAVAVIGASRHPESVGAAVVRNLVASRFPGPVYPVNPAATLIQSLPSYPSVEAIEGPVDLAVIALPAAGVVEAALQCGRKGVQALVVLSSGFGEAGAEGKVRQVDLMRVCTEYGIRMVGPNCIGVINTDSHAPLNATFGPIMPRAGRLGLATQSGAVGLAAIDFAAARGLGFSSIVSMGNKADLSGNDLLSYWHSDPRTDVILLYLESFGNPQKFSRLARSIGRSKPILALKPGRSAVGARASGSHTGALLATSDVTVDALFRQAGVVRTDTLDEMLNVADLLVHQPLPRGRRVAIVTNAGGPAVMCADTCEAHGLDVPSLSAETVARLRSLLPAEASVANPVDMLAAADGRSYRQVVETVAQDPNVDSVIAIFLPPLATQPEEVADALASAADQLADLQLAKPVLGVFMSASELPDLSTANGRRIPGYQTPEPAAIALAHAVRYADWLARPIDALPVLGGIDPDQAGLLLAEALESGGGWLNPRQVRRLLALYGVPTVDSATPAEAGVEMLVGVVNDRLFGPTIACGAGGTVVELVKDVSLRLSPLTAADAANMVRELRSFPLLNGYRGAPPCDVQALEDVLLRIGALASDHPSIAELDCNPVMVTGSGAVVVDARVRVEEAAPRRPLGARH